jgi:hypothetical protein
MQMHRGKYVNSLLTPHSAEEANCNSPPCLIITKSSFQPLTLS